MAVISASSRTSPNHLHEVLLLVDAGSGEPPREVFVTRYLWLVFLVLMTSVASLINLVAHNSSSQVSKHAVMSGPDYEDPDKRPSELNHHVAGYALITVGLLVIASQVFPRLRALQLVWPALFLLAGVFLATWSDAEIWPRGNLTWGWLLHHDPEARQHKIFAILLMAISLLEFLRARASLPTRWRIWAFPVLALAGAGLLLAHDHSSDSGVRSPEVRAYLVNPAFGPDGSASPDGAVGPITTMAPDHDFVGKEHDSNISRSDEVTSNMDHSGMQMGIGMHNNDDPPPMPHSHMTAAMRQIENQHFWFVIVGFAIAVFKLIDDSKRLRHPFVSQGWPTCIVVLGILLALYRE